MRYLESTCSKKAQVTLWVALTLLVAGCHGHGDEAKKKTDKPASTAPASSVAKTEEAKITSSGEVKADVKIDLTPANNAILAGGDWGTIKGQVIWGGADIPPRAEITPSQDGAHCLAANPTADKDKGVILSDALLVNKANKGLENVFVWLISEPGKKIAIHPDAPKPGKKVEIDQPFCAFMPKAVAIQEGDTVVVKNSSPVNHNFNWSGDAALGNKGENFILKQGETKEIKGLVTQRLPIVYACSIHPWMSGRLAVLTNPYFAITDKDGKFVIPNAPVGTFKLMVYHQEIGYLGGAKGRNGHEITIKSGVNDKGTMEMGGK